MKYKDLSKKEKLEYIWDYYKLHIIGGTSAVVFIIWIAVSVISGLTTNTIFDLTIIARSIDVDVMESLESELNNLLIEDEKHEEISVDFLSNSQRNNPNEDMAFNTRLQGKAAANILDLLITQKVDDNSMYTLYAESGLFLELDDFIKSNKISIDKDLLVYNNYNGESKIYGIDISNNEKIKGLVSKDTTIILSICASSNNIENDIETINYLLD